jgi:hypothetical protein
VVTAGGGHLERVTSHAAASTALDGLDAKIVLGRWGKVAIGRDLRPPRRRRLECRGRR